MFFYREPEEAEKEEQAAKEYKEVAVKPEAVTTTHEPAEVDWTENQHWPEETPQIAVPAAAAAAAPFAPAEDWAAEVQENWAVTNAAAQPAIQPNWGTTPDWH